VVQRLMSAEGGKWAGDTTADREVWLIKFPDMQICQATLLTAVDILGERGASRHGPRNIGDVLVCYEIGMLETSRWSGAEETLGGTSGWEKICRGGKANGTKYR